MDRTFKYGTVEIRTVAKNNQVWLSHKDVCFALSIKPSISTFRKIPAEWKIIDAGSSVSSINKPVYFISIAAAYKLAFQSRNPDAENFSRWLTSSVLPVCHSKERLSYQKATSESNTTMPSPTVSKVNDIHDLVLKLLKLKNRISSEEMVFVRHDDLDCIRKGYYNSMQYLVNLSIFSLQIAQSSLESVEEIVNAVPFD